jgi:NADP-dependent aldehyde dehydrogenase
VLFLPAGHGLNDALAAHAASATTGALLTESITAGFADRLRSVVDDIGGRQLVESTADSHPTSGLLVIDYPTFERHRQNVLTEVFGPFSVVVEYSDTAELVAAASLLEGSLTVTLHAEEQDGDVIAQLLGVIEQKAGRVIVNEWPTGVSVTSAQQHGGPFPSTTNPLHTAVGTAAVDRFLRPVAYQNFFQSWLPEPLRDANPWGVPQHRTHAGESERWGRDEV